MLLEVPPNGELLEFPKLGADFAPKFAPPKEGADCGMPNPVAEFDVPKLVELAPKFELLTPPNGFEPAQNSMSKKGGFLACKDFNI